MIAHKHSACGLTLECDYSAAARAIHKILACMACRKLCQLAAVGQLGMACCGHNKLCSCGCCQLIGAYERHLLQHKAALVCEGSV